MTALTLTAGQYVGWSPTSPTVINGVFGGAYVTVIETSYSQQGYSAHSGSNLTDTFSVLTEAKKRIVRWRERRARFHALVGRLYPEHVPEEDLPAPPVGAKERRWRARAVRRA